MARLTDAAVRALAPPPKGQKKFFDDSLHGFGVRVSQGGSRTFILQVGADRRLISIGRYPVISLAQARDEAKRLLAEFTLGRLRPQSLSFPQAVELFLQDKARSKRARTVADYKRLLIRHFPFRGPLTDVSHAQVMHRIERLADTPSESNHARTAGTIFFNWCLKRRYVTENPLYGLSPHSHTPRSRVLSYDELGAIWRTLSDEGSGLPLHFRAVVKLCILTLQRRGEVAALRTSWVDDTTVTFPPEAVKNNREHFLPLCQAAGDMLRSCEVDRSRNDALFFPGRRSDEQPFRGWSKAKKQLDQASGVTGYTLHDLRRTGATRLAELGAAPHIIERILNHITGSMSPLSRVYNRARYLAEMRAALDLWEAHLLKHVALRGVALPAAFS